MRILLIALILVLGTLDASAQNRRSMRFANMDDNRDGVITRQEWRGTARAFDRNDWNGDGILSGDEVTPAAERGRNDDDDADSDAHTFGPGEREYDFVDWTPRGFVALDDNRDGRITRDEWRFEIEGFRRADHNRDGVVSRAEFLGDPNAQVDRDDRFADLDADGDGRLSRDEFGSARTTRTPAWQRGHERGLAEGRQAGKEDRAATWGWDLDGQRELEQADSGYEARFGPRPEYQAGYREGFKKGYREGFGPR